LSQDKNFVKLNGGGVILDSALDNGNTVTCAFLIKHQAPQEVAA